MSLADLPNDYAGEPLTTAAVFTYPDIAKGVRDLVEHHIEVDATVAAYLVIRSGLLAVVREQGTRRAAEIAYHLADEFAAR